MSDTIYPLHEEDPEGKTNLGDREEYKEEAGVETREPETQELTHW